MEYAAHVITEQFNPDLGDEEFVGEPEIYITHADTGVGRDNVDHFPIGEGGPIVTLEMRGFKVGRHIGEVEPGYDIYAVTK